MFEYKSSGDRLEMAYQFHRPVKVKIKQNMKLATLFPVLLVLLVLFDCSMAQFGGGGFGRMGGMRGFGKIFFITTNKSIY